LHGLTGHRITQSGRDLGQRLQDKPPFSKPRMRQDQSGFVTDDRAKQDQIEVEGPRGARVGPLAASLPLDGQEGVQQLALREVRLPHRRGIQKPGRFDGHSNRRRLADRRYAKIGKQRPEAAEPELEVGLAISEVRTERDRSDYSITQRVNYSIQRVGSTSPIRLPT
jgi:hypothetical protein